MSFIVSSVMTAQANEFLRIDSKPSIRFTLSSRVTNNTTNATISFEEDGDQKLPPGGYVSVNGIALPVTPLKYGFWYRAQIPKSKKYILRYSIATGQPVTQYIFNERQFIPKMPNLVSRGKGLVMEFSGATLVPGETIFSDIGDPSEGSGRWSETLRPAAVENKLIYHAAQLSNVRLGQSIMYVGVTLREYFPNDRITFIQAYGDEQPVRVID